MKSSISSYHMKGGLYENSANRGNPTPKRCRLRIRDTRPVPELTYPIDAVLRRQEQERKAALRLRALEEEVQRREAERYAEQGDRS